MHLGTPKRKTVTEIEPDEGAVLAQTPLLLLGQCRSRLGLRWLLGCLPRTEAGWLAGWLHLGDRSAELRVCDELLGGTLLESWELALSLAEQPCYKGLDDAVALLELLHKDDVWRLGLAAQLGLCAEAVGRVGAQAGWRSAVGSVAPLKKG